MAKSIQGKWFGNSEDARVTSIRNTFLPFINKQNSISLAKYTYGTLVTTITSTRIIRIILKDSKNSRYTIKRSKIYLLLYMYI